ncbi:MAG: hypothetical protein OHK0046_10730 [Anaerolineae bacterium]
MRPVTWLLLVLGVVMLGVLALFNPVMSPAQCVSTPPEAAPPVYPDSALLDQTTESGAIIAHYTTSDTVRDVLRYYERQGVNCAFVTQAGRHICTAGRLDHQAYWLVIAYDQPTQPTEYFIETYWPPC